MQLIRNFSTFLLFLGISSLCQANSDETSIAYNWARSGLNIRDSPERRAKVMGAIPFGETVEILEETTRELSIELSDVFSQKFSEGGSSYYVEGSWVKVKFGKIVGYAFDGYLAAFPPMQFIEAKDGNAYPEGFESYLRMLSVPIDSSITAEPNSDYRHRNIRFANGATYEKRGNVGWYEEVFMLPEASLKVGFLFFQLGFESMDFIGVDDSEKVYIMKQNSRALIFSGALGMEYEIYQFGSTLIIRISDSC
ncbi:MAG: SH3 domain-containing protein [Bacteroidota bacterium]